MSLLVATVDYIPNRKYKILGVVDGTAFTTNRTIKKMISKAEKIEADAIIGLRPYGTGVIVGTAIKFLDEN